MRPLPASFVSSIVNLACEIQSIPSPTFFESKRAAFFLKLLATLNLTDIQIDPSGNVLARIPGVISAKPLIICAHMDTVHPADVPLTLRRTEDRIIGPGIGDNALGLASLIGLIRLLHVRENKLPGDLWIVFNVAEEGLGDLRGMQAIVDRFGGNPLAYLIVEGLGLGTILHRGLGVERYRIAVHTAGGHSWVDFGHPSAIHELCIIVSRLTGLTIPHSPCTTWNAGIFHGGTSVNTIAPDAWIELDLRSEDRKTLENLINDVMAVANSVRRPNVHVSIEQIGKRIAGEIPASHPLVQLAREVLIDLKLEPRLDIASTDANQPLSRGFPAICIGITNGNNAHTREEYMLTGQVGQGLQQLHQIVMRAWESLP